MSKNSNTKTRQKVNNSLSYCERSQLYLPFQIIFSLFIIKIFIIISINHGGIFCTFYVDYFGYSLGFFTCVMYLQIHAQYQYDVTKVYRRRCFWDVNDFVIKPN